MITEEPRPATSEDVPALAQLWHDGWQDAHSGILPKELARQRTLDSFRQRLIQGLPAIRTIGPAGDPDGFSFLKGDELNQFYVHRRARGTGLAASLIADAEREFAAAGVPLAWLACAIGNDRAARFYERQGWSRIGVVTIRLDLADGPFPLEVWRYEKALGRTAPSTPR
jgi:GNAT superfamily N-acetyltransferase